MTRAVQRLVAALAIALALGGPVAADDFKTGLSAYNTGDYIKAFRVWLALAEQDDARAQAGLGFMYHKGLGVVSDDDEAAYWLERGAQQGQAEAQLLLGVLYFYGRGVKQSFVQAFAWCELAQIHGQSDAMECRNVATESMNAAELKESFRLVTDWLQRRRAAKP